MIGGQSVKEIRSRDSKADRRREPIIIGVTGATMSGKTVFANALADRLREQGYIVEVYPEPVESAIEQMKAMGYDVEDPREFITMLRSTKDVVKFQQIVLSKQIKLECAAMKSDSQIVILDRTVIDWLYFFVKYCSKYDDTSYYLYALETLYNYGSQCRGYDVVFLCDFRDIKNDTLPNPLRAEGDEDKVERYKQHMFITGILLITKTPFRPVKGTVDERVEKAIAYLSGKVLRTVKPA